MQKIVTGLAEKLLKPCQRLTAVDSTVTSVFGHQIQGADLGYNPHKPGRDSYHPLLAADVATRSVIDAYLRPGSCASAHGLDGFIRKLITESKHPADQFVETYFFCFHLKLLDENVDVNNSIRVNIQQDPS